MKQIVSFADENGQEYGVSEDQVESFQKSNPSARRLFEFSDNKGAEYSVAEDQVDSFVKSNPTTQRVYAFADDSGQEYSVAHSAMNDFMQKNSVKSDPTPTPQEPPPVADAIDPEPKSDPVTLRLAGPEFRQAPGVMGRAARVPGQVVDVANKAVRVPGSVLTKVFESPETIPESASAFEIGRQRAHEYQKLWNWNRPATILESVKAGDAASDTVNRFAAAIKEHDARQAQWQTLQKKRGDVGTFFQGVAGMMGPVLETAAASTTGLAGKVASFDYFMRQGYGDLMSSGLKRYGIDPATLTAKQIEELDKTAKKMSAVYAGIEFIQQAIPGAPGSKLAQKLVGKVPLLNNIVGRTIGRAAGESGEEGLQKYAQESFDKQIASILFTHGATQKQLDAIPTLKGSAGEGFMEALRTFPTILAGFGVPGAIMETVGKALAGEDPGPLTPVQPEENQGTEESQPPEASPEAEKESIPVAPNAGAEAAGQGPIEQPVKPAEEPVLPIDAKEIEKVVLAGESPDARSWAIDALRQAESRGQIINNFPMDQLKLDPKRFQYKIVHGKEGSTGSLDGVEVYDRVRGGVISVWRDPADQQVYVINGHNRFGKAKELGVKDHAIQFLQVPTERAARAYGALINISEGRGSIVDAAKYFRDANITKESVKELGLPLSESRVERGLALARLNEKTFNDVVQGKMDESLGVAIGNEFENHDDQAEFLKLIRTHKREPSLRVIREWAELIKNSPKADGTPRGQMEMFQQTESEKKLIFEKARVNARINALLSSDKVLFGKVGTERAAERLGIVGNKIDPETNLKISREAETIQEVFNRLKNSDMAPILNRAAQEVANGKEFNEIIRRVYTEVRDEVGKALGRRDPVGGASNQEDNLGGVVEAGKRGQGEQSSTVNPSAPAAELPGTDVPMNLVADSTPDNEQVMRDQEKERERERDFKARQGSLFASPAPGDASATPPSLAGINPYQPGDNRPVPIHNDPAYSVFHLDLPEVVQFAEQLTGGKRPDVVRKIRALKGTAAGLFIPVGEGAIQVRADMARLVSGYQKSIFKAQAELWADAQPQVTPANRQDLIDSKFKELYEEAYNEAYSTTGPRAALMVLTHEIGHAADWQSTPHQIHGRGNIFGHVAAFSRYLNNMLARLPENQDQLITPQERKALRARAVREKSDYQGLVRDLAEVRGLVTRTELLAELEPLIAWYNGTDEMPEYYAKPTEMYAEALSVFINNPAASRTKSPIFWGLVHNWMQERPKFKAEYDAIQKLINQGPEAVQDNRWKRMMDMFAKANRIARWSEKQMNEMTYNEMKDGFLSFIDSKYAPWQWRMKKMDKASRQSALDAIDAMQYRATVVQGFWSRIQEQVGIPVFDAGMDWDKLGGYMMFQRVLGDRAEYFNPLGIDPPAAKAGIEHLFKTLGPEKFAILEQARVKYFEIWKQEIIDRAREYQIWDKQILDELEQRTFYATFAVRKGEVNEEQTSLRFVLEQKYGHGPTSHLFKQYGTTDNIENPATALMEKGAALINMIHKEFAKRTAIETIQTNPELWAEWTPATETFDANKKMNVPVVKLTDWIGTLMYLHEGKIKAFYGPRLMVEAFDSMNPIESQLSLRALNFTASTLKNAWTRWSPGFWPVAHFRDIQRVNSMPGTIKDWRTWVPFSGGAFGRYAPRAYKAAWSAVIRGRPNDDAIELYRRGSVISRAEGYRGENLATSKFEVNLRRAGLRMDLFGEADSTVRKFFDFYNNFAQVGEFATKAAATWHVDDAFPAMSEGEKRRMVHGLGGSPNFLNKPNATGSQITSLFLLFFNPWKEGLRSEKRYLQQYKGERVLHYARFVALPLAALMGWVYSKHGDDDDQEDRQAQWEAIPLKDRRNYLTFPVGWENKADHRVAYIALPWEENFRLAAIAIGGIYDYILKKDAKELGQIMNYEADQLPGINPVTKLAYDWFDYKQGNVPQDYSGRPVLTDDQQTIRKGKFFSMVGQKAMGIHTYNQTLASLFGRINNDGRRYRDLGILEKTLNAPGIKGTVGRIIRVSNRGYLEQRQALTTPTDVAQAEIRIKIQNYVQDEQRKRTPDSGTFETLVSGQALFNAGDKISLDSYAYQYYVSQLKASALQNAPVDVQLYKNADKRGRAIIEQDAIQKAMKP